MTDRLEVPIQALVNFAQMQNQTAAPESLNIIKLEGGHVAAQVYRFDLQFRLAKDDLKTVSFVQKHTTANEVQVMKRLAQDFRLAAIPAFVESYIDEAHRSQNGASWFVSPFYAGDLLTFDDDLPTEIISALAAIHAHYLTRTEQLDGIPQYDGAFTAYLRDFVMAVLEENKARFSASQITEFQSQLPTAEDAQLLGTVFQRLPKTLTHGDVHPGNIIRTSAGDHVLFDWGNARIAPGMLDLANMVQMDSPEWTVYVEAWEAASGTALEPGTARLSYFWATAIINMQYMPFALGHLEPGMIQGMIERFHKALDSLR